MTTPARRRRGRAIRRRRRILQARPQQGTVFVDLQVDTRAFERAIHDLMRIFERFSRVPVTHQQILHNGKKP